ncbi:hypothetical protein Phi13:2_gp089 [Cellulophaga phage phi13:2]|uniref:Uncharacterized protein n=4 Tax=Pachyviridae TaxID=2946166 RepID=R9ZZS6_9CAUD|nr:hypothetical protein Phi19:3_gp092 [Cellulophaga phage phi19:3]YP_008241128.1 hypothetical protein Phi46:3_gp085 [Cellulophaga phage phi46:3]YP_008241282.1 hypothetical protein Phi18:3_gp089 [Cellulophaga phage phi18:3]YP_008242114.1 hypothetical protein Phi13:2_gp089 [Cellulophaga phage phi13:2]AGO47496.1 hypothetical protein Phi19:3_gp092 [Cellulophaga phage phi19:3]AGO48601.1 hypothetical protein Phi18:3_gp089 [Cellulophaga phage phi18:3]AGO48829.1 hypothetical protein Phi46:3_gp085 [Ce
MKTLIAISIICLIIQYFLEDTKSSRDNTPKTDP